MKRDLTKLEIEQLDIVVKDINKKLEDNESLNKHMRFHVIFERMYKKDNLLYLLNETAFDFRKHILPMLKPINDFNIDLFVFNDDQSGALRMSDEGFAYKKGYKVEFHITLTKQEIFT